MQAVTQVMVDCPASIQYCWPLNFQAMPKKIKDSPTHLSRRAFARGAAFVAAGAMVLPQFSEGQQAPPPSSSAPVTTPEKKLPEAGEKKLSATAEAELEAKYNRIVSTYGNRLSAEQKEEVHRQLTDQVKALESVRAAAIDNSVQPATVLKIVRGKA